MSPDLAVWIVGEWRHAEFGNAVAWLKWRTRCAFFDDAGAALAGRRSIGSLDVPTAIVLMEARPGAIGRGDVERLHEAAPLARLVALVGAWCEGELRSGRPWRGVVRVPMGAWRFRLERELGLKQGNGSLLSQLPRTMTASERLDINLAELRQCHGRAQIVTSLRANYEASADTLGRLGIESAWQREPDGRSRRGCDCVRRMGTRQATANESGGIGPVRLLLMHFPHCEDLERANREGIAAVVAQPALLTDLAEAIRIAMPNAAIPHGASQNARTTVARCCVDECNRA